MKTVETMTNEELQTYIDRPNFHQVSATSVLVDKHNVGTFYRVSISRIGYYNQGDAWYEVRVDRAIGPANQTGPGGAAVQYRSVGEMYPFKPERLAEAVECFKGLVKKYEDPATLLASLSS